jgi:hypothetical protein
MISPLALLAVLSVVATSTTFLATLFVYDQPSKSFGQVVASSNISQYGFGARRALVLLNLTAYRNASDVRDVGDRGLNGADDIHMSHKRIALMTVYKGDGVYNNVSEWPVGIDQKGGDRPQINLGIEMRDPASPFEDADVQLLDDLEEEVEDYFLRGCYFEPSCTRDFAPTVLDVTPQLKGELVEVLFWQEGIGYTYEGVYGLFAKMKRKYYQATVPWVDNGKVNKDAPCNDTFADVGLVYESERERAGRDEFNAFERLVQAEMVYPKESYVTALRDGCNDTYATVLDYFHLPNLRNVSAVPLNLTTFVQMYMAAQLLQQVDFGFQGMQQYYYKRPHDTALATGPPYDFDGPWELCGTDKDTVDIVACVQASGPSPLWQRLGRDEEFIALWRTEGLEILDRDMQEVRTLYEDRRRMYDNGSFARHEARWAKSGRTKTGPMDFARHLTALARERAFDGASRDTIGKELDYQLAYYTDRYRRLRRNVAAADGFDVHVTFEPYVWVFLQVFWWAIVFGVGPFVVLCVWTAVACVRCCHRPRPHLRPPPAAAATELPSRAHPTIRQREIAAQHRRDH